METLPSELIRCVMQLIDDRCTAIAVQRSCWQWRTIMRQILGNRLDVYRTRCNLWLQLRESTGIVDVLMHVPPTEGSYSSLESPLTRLRQGGFGVPDDSIVVPLCKEVVEFASGEKVRCARRIFFRSSLPTGFQCLLMIEKPRTRSVCDYKCATCLGVTKRGMSTLQQIRFRHRHGAKRARSNVFRA